MVFKRQRWQTTTELYKAHHKEQFSACQASQSSAATMPAARRAMTAARTTIPVARTIPAPRTTMATVSITRADDKTV
ncbi:hypothetical protein FHG87_010565 [Trinorchestia longiramus]|nr:hypothetical protein FHG87_010565 [Trinorchestia longiramus]